MRQQARLVEYQASHCSHIVHRAVVAVIAKPGSGHFITILGSLTEREQRFVTAAPRTLARNFQHVVGEQVRLIEPRWWLRECAVATLISTQHREWDEDLRRIRDPCAMCSVTHDPSRSEQSVEGCFEKVPGEYGGGR